MSDHNKFAEAMDLRIDQVIRSLETDVPEAPQHSFIVRSSDEWKAAGKSAGVIGICVFLRMAYKAHANGTSPAFFIILTILSLALILFSCLSRSSAEITGDTLSAKGHSYSSDRIERMAAYGINYILLYSGGRMILKVSMSDPGCDELVKWVRYNGIPVEKNDDSDISKRKRILYAAAGLAVFAGAAAAFCYLSLR